MARKYYRDTMEYVKPEPHHKLVEKWGIVTLQQVGYDAFAVRYGMEVDAGLTYSEACAKLGQALMHQAACEGKIRVKG